MFWDVELLVLTGLSLPALLQLTYWAAPFQTLDNRGKKTARLLFPKYRIRIGHTVPLAAERLPTLGAFRLHRVTETGMIFRSGSFWSGTEVVLRNRAGEGAEIQWSSLNVMLLDAMGSATLSGSLLSPSAFIRLLAAELDNFKPEPQLQDTQAFFNDFEGRFHLPFPEILKPEAPIALLLEGNACMVSTATANDPCVLPDQFEALPEQQDDPYWFSGTWGYGANSYAFYYVDIRPHRRIWMRLPFGGAYGDPERQSRQIAEVISDLARLLTESPYCNADLHIVQNMGRGEITIHTQEQKVLKHAWCFPDTANALNELACHGSTRS